MTYKYRHRRTGLWLKQHKLIGYSVVYTLETTGTTWNRNCLSQLNLIVKGTKKQERFSKEDFETVTSSEKPFFQI